MFELIPQEDLAFLLYEWLQIEALCKHERFADHERATFDAILASAESLAKDKFANHAALIDQNEPHLQDGVVQIIPEVKEALQDYFAAGFLAGGFGAEMGGMQLPYTIFQAYHALFNAANVSTTGYPFLTGAAANLLCAFGSPEQKERFVSPMLAGRYFGTMCLSEPQAGSSLGDITTKATPTDDPGCFLISGSKMWISGGEHELSENIIHLVLAKIPGGPPGVKGISLLIVPRYRLQPDGSKGPHNDVHLAGINHKMGYRGTVNTVLNFGERGDCHGYLVGEPHKGLRYMFHMMNEARIGVGLGASALGYVGYRLSLDYAKTRKQGRPATSKDPAQPPVAIIEHTDVKRMLLAQKSYVEGALALGLYCARIVDTLQVSQDDAEIAQLQRQLDLLTPIAKAWPSQYCLKANDLAIQVLGGYGYTREYHAERLYRDNRLNPIHEGTNGIQALDLLGRKVLMHNGQALQELSQDFATTAHQAKEIPALSAFADALTQAIERIQETTMALAQIAIQGQIDLFLANASEYLDLLGTTTIAWIWLQQAIVAQRALTQSHQQPDATRSAFYQGKLLACQYFFRWELPRTIQSAALLQSLDDTCLNAPSHCL